MKQGVNGMNEKKEVDKKEESNVIKKLKWRRPTFISISADEIARHISAAARSGMCGGGNVR